MHTMYVPIVLRYVRSILLVSCIFCQKERIHTFTHSSLLDPTTKNLLSPLDTRPERLRRHFLLVQKKIKIYVVFSLES